MIKATYEKPPASESARACLPDPEDTYLGGLVMGYRWPDFFYAADQNHELVGFAGYPVGGIRMIDVLFGSVERLCKGQSILNR